MTENVPRVALTRCSLRQVAESIVCAVLDVANELPPDYGGEGTLALGDAVLETLAELGVRIVDDEEEASDGGLH